MTNSGLFQTEEFVDDNFRFDENGRKFSKQIENTVGKGEIARFEQFLLFPVFSKDFYCKQVKKPGLVWDRVNPFPTDKFFTVSNSKLWQKTIVDLMRMAEFSPNW